MTYRFYSFALALFVLGAPSGARAEEVPPPITPVTSTDLAVGLDAWVGVWPRSSHSLAAAVGYDLYGRYRVLPNLSIGGSFGRLLHTNVPCHDDFCVASATLFGATARYHGAGESTFDPWVQLGLGAAVSEEKTLRNNGGFYYTDESTVVRPSFEAKAGLDYRFAFMAVGLDARMIGFGDPYHLYAAGGLHAEARW